MLSILDGSELAQYVTQEGSNANVVYFVARAAFSRPPTNFTAQDVTVVNGEHPPVTKLHFCHLTSHSGLSIAVGCLNTTRCLHGELSSSTRLCSKSEVNNGIGDAMAYTPFPGLVM